MTHRIIWALFLSLLTLSCGPPSIESEPDAMGIFDHDTDFETTLEGPSLIENDPFDLRARGEGQPNKGQVVQSIEPRLGPWTGYPQLGNSFDFEPSNSVGVTPAADNRQAILKLDEWGMPKVWSVMLGVEFDENDPPDNFFIAAEIEFGVGGATQKVVVDWINGTSISAVMNAVNVTALYLQGAPPTGDIRLMATLAQGTLPNSSPTRTLFRSAAAGGTQVVQIPKFASHVIPLQRGNIFPFVNTTFLDFLTPTGGGVARVRGDLIGDYGGVIPVPRGATQLEVDNTAGASDIDLALVFKIGL